MTQHSGGITPARELEIIVDADGVDDTTTVISKGRGRDRDHVTVPVSTAQFRQSVERNVAALREIFERVAGTDSAFPLREVQISFEVSAKGGFQLIGTSEVAGKGAITLVFGAADAGPAARRTDG
ncbi:Pepco domain-containing protein [Streptomyces sp. SP18CS02]|uniref:Pepco domain-containing protein n=1 Tax=Streptomyces sp. SP18CS02 TaxID=3002531 RepID=UPI002E78F4E0|nr:hypothetical protein [Streptomyces sp. SP18CS02]MEE1756093.1 hypothetical protein [Streptomyces sp. SP18CS02]